MAKGLDKDALKKNGFWIGLGGFVLLWLIAAVMVLLPGEIEGKTKFEAAKKDMDGAKSTRPKTPAYQTPWNEHKAKFTKQKDTVWQAAWKQQETMYDWPKEMAFQPQYFDDDWTDSTDNRGRFRDLYQTQFGNIERFMFPVEMAGGVVGVMQPQGWNTEYAKTGGWNPNKAPTREEIWLAQEDYWVKRELLFTIREAVNTVAFFRDVTEEVLGKELDEGGQAPEKKDEKDKDDKAKSDEKNDKGKGKDAAKAKDKDDKAKSDDKTSDKDKDAAKAKDKGDKANDKNDKDKDAAKAKDKGDKGKADENDEKDKGDKGKADEKDEETKKKEEEARKKEEEDRKKKEEAERKKKIWELSAKSGHRRVLRNANWELDIRFEKPSGKWVIDKEKSKIKNVNSLERTQPLANPKNQGLAFRLYSTENTRTSYALIVQGEPVPYGDKAPITSKSLAVEPLNPERPFGVEQVLEWEMSPVRRIEAIEVPYQSHRTAVAPLKIREALKELDKDAEPPAPETAKDGATGGGMGGMPGPSGPGPKGGLAGPGGLGGGPSEAQPGDYTPINKINRVRYLVVKEQSRHLPIAIRLIVDQSHVHDVLAAIANSRLRIQITQVSAHYVRNVQRGSVGGPSGGKDGRPGDYPLRPTPGGMSEGGMGMNMPGPMGGRPLMPTMPTMPSDNMKNPKMGGGGGPEQPTDAIPIVQDTAKLVELSVYGIAALYERFPARPPKTDGGSTTPPKSP